MKKLIITFSITLILLLNMQNVFAACSPYMGMATLNEFFKNQSNQVQDVTDFAEVKILNTSLTFSNWTIEICESNVPGNNNDADGCSTPILLNTFQDQTPPWIVLSGDIGSYINFKTGFDAILKDENGLIVDYVSVSNYSALLPEFTATNCQISSLPYPYQAGAPGASDKFIFRTPDGTGSWGSQPAASAPPSENSTNDSLPPPPPGESYPFVTINNISPNIGSTAIFTVSLEDINGNPTSFSQDVTVSYYTRDGSATAADNDYSPVALTTPPVTITIPANQTSVTISIDISLSDFDDIGQNFFLILNAIENYIPTGSPNAAISNHVGTATLNGNGCSFTTTGIYGETLIDIENNISFNNGTSTSTLTPGATTNNSIVLDGTSNNQTLPLPALPPITFVNSPDPTLPADAPLIPGNYDNVNVDINTTITLAAGTYNIDRFILGRNVTLNITGSVTINTNEFIADGNAVINNGGDPANLTVNIYNQHNAEFDLGDDSVFVGIVYSSFSNATIEIDDNNTFTGAIYTTGTVDLKDNSNIIYNGAARRAAALSIGCIPVRIAPTVNSLTTVNTTPTITGTYDSSDAALGFTVTINGITYTLGTSPELTAAGDNWSLAIAAPLTNGTYDVVATSTNASGNTISDTTINEVIIGTTSCFSDTYPIYAGTQLEIENGITFTNNGNTTNLTAGQTTTPSAINLAGIVSNQATTLPALPPITFVNSPDPTLPADGPLTPGSYDRVSVSDNATITLTAGTYNIDELDIGSNVTIIIAGPVIINTNEFIADGDATINNGGDPANLIVNIYNNHNAEFDLGDDSTFFGVVYSSFTNTTIEIDDDNNFTGAILTNGEVVIKDNSDIFYTTAAQAAAATVLGCNATILDHFAINYLDGPAGTGVNCQAERITIEAHDASHNVITDYTGTVDLSNNLSHGDWSKTTNPTDANNTLNTGIADTGTATYTFITSDNGSIILNFQDTHTELANLHVEESGGGLSEISNAATADDDFEIDFTSAGFVFLTDNTTNPIGLQIGAKPSNVAPGNQSLEIQAIRTNDSTGACEAALSGSQSLEFAFECLNPSTCTSNNLQVSVDNGITYSDVSANNNAATPLTYSTITNLDFGTTSDNTAPIVIRYNDVGRVRMHVRKVLTPSNEVMLRASNAFVVRPFAFFIDIPGNPAATSAGGNVFTTAGNDFTANVRAVLWQAEDDDASAGVGISGDGIADGHEVTDFLPANNVNLSDNATALNYGQETAPNNAPASSIEHVYLNALLNQPGVYDPALADSSTNNNQVISFNPTTGTGSTSTIHYDEVGIIELHASVADSDYLDIGVAESVKIAGRSGFVGRFRPDHFDNTLAHGCTGFTYSGQPFSVTATAMNSRTPAVATQNYTGTFAFNTTLSDAGNTANFNATNIIPAASFTNGTALKNDVVYTFPVKDTAPSTITIRANDPDTVAAVGVTEGTTEIRSGRMRLENVYGPETFPLTVPVRVEYFSDNATVATTDDGYVLNSIDSCSNYDSTTSTLGSYTGNLSSGEIAVSGTGFVIAGIENPANLITLHQPGDITQGPGAGNDGSVNLLLNVDPWLEYNWGFDCDGDTVNDGDSCATASFGLYRGDDRIIYWREIFN